MLLAGLTLLPALLAIFGRAAFWPSRTAQGTGRPGWWGRTAGRTVTHPAATLAFGLVAFGALATAVLGYRPADLGTPAAPGGSDSAAGNALLAAHFPAASSNPTTRGAAVPRAGLERPGTSHRGAAAARRAAPVRQPGRPVRRPHPRPADDAARHARRPGRDPCGAATGDPYPGRRVGGYRAETQFISPDGRTVVFDARLVDGDPGSNAALRQVPALRAAVAAVARAAGASAYGVAGAVPAGYDVSQVSDADLLRIFPVAIIVIGLLLALVMRSLVAPLYLIASVVISYLAAWGLSVLLFQDAARAGGLYYVIPFLMFIFLLALGEDYNILVMTRIREEAGRIPLRQAVTAALERTGPTVSSAGLVLAGTFASSPWRTRPARRRRFPDILASIAIGILMDAFLVRTLLVPATVALLGRWNWWPSSHGTPSQATQNPNRHQHTAVTSAPRRMEPRLHPASREVTAPPPGVPSDHPPRVPRPAPAG